MCELHVGLARWKKNGPFCAKAVAIPVFQLQPCCFAWWQAEVVWKKNRGGVAEGILETNQQKKQRNLVVLEISTRHIFPTSMWKPPAANCSLYTQPFHFGRHSFPVSHGLDPTGGVGCVDYAFHGFFSWVFFSHRFFWRGLPWVDCIMKNGELDKVLLGPWGRGPSQRRRLGRPKGHLCFNHTPVFVEVSLIGGKVRTLQSPPPKPLCNDLKKRKIF